MPTFPGVVTSDTVISSAHMNALRTALIATYTELYSPISDINHNSHAISGVTTLTATTVAATTITGTSATIPTVTVTTLHATNLGRNLNANGFNITSVATLAVTGSLTSPAATITAVSATTVTVPTITTATITASGASVTITGGPVINAAKGNTFGTAAGSSALSPVALTDANILLYNISSVNWAGIGTDSNGSVWIRTGLSGSLASALLIATNGFVYLPRTLGFASDAAAGTGGATTGALYYNTSDNTIRRKT